ncbi:ABC transporter ATP-binding protein [Rhodoglobus aureus]|uniref:ABC transporter ATP-binding protein n=1 Tax=Rhodoglobus aureus TaxID=191497 RepID=A0ABP4GCE6_9MICO
MIESTGTTPTVTDSILTVSDLSASIEGQQVVEAVSFEMLPVGVTALLGRNGVGKTSTLRAIMGLIERSGEVTLAGERVDREPTHRIVQRGVGYVPEDREVFASLTVAENLRLAERDSNPNRELIAELFPDLTQRSGQLAGTLSGGQQQMVSLARALVNDNRVLLVDEPTKGLAPLIVMDVARALERAAQTVPVLLVEQNLQVVRMLAKKAIVLEGGHVVYDGSAEELLGNEALTKELLGVA